MVAFVEPRHHDVAALDQPHVVARGLAQPLVQHRFTHGPAALTIARAATSARRSGRASCARQRPPSRFARDALGARENLRAAGRGVPRVCHHQPRVVHPAVGIDEAVPEFRLEAGMHRAARSSRTACEPGKPRPAPEVVVEKEAGADHPARPQLRHVRHDEAHRAHEVRRDPEQHLALGERLRHQPEFDTARGSAARRGSACCSRSWCARRDRPSRPAARRARARPRRARCRRR